MAMGMTASRTGSSGTGHWWRRASGSIALSTLALLLAGCGHDAADRDYFAALDGEEKGMTREQQIALIDRAIFLAPKRAYYYETRAGYWIDLRQFDHALADLDRAIAMVDRP